jgi:hypothetical protein
MQTEQILCSAQNGDVSDARRAPLPRPSREVLSRGYWALKRRSAFVQHSVAETAILRSWADRRYRARRSLHADHLPALSREHRGILADLRDTGVAIRTLDLPRAVLDSADIFVDLLRAKQTNAPCAKTTSRELAWDPTLFMWGLSEDLLDLAECHIGLPPRYLGVEVKREIANPAAGHSHEAVRRWHLDHEDRRILKVIVYLSDVDRTSAPFEYVDLTTSEAVLRGLNRPCRSARLDEAVRAQVPPRERTQVTGPRLTAIYVDTGRVLHRVAPPVSERHSVTFAYCSRSPRLTYSQLTLPGAERRALRDRLTQRQWQALGCTSFARPAEHAA